MSQRRERIKIPFCVTKAGGKVSLLARKAESDSEIDLSKFNPKEGIEFTHTPISLFDSQNSVHYENGIVVEPPGEEARWAGGLVTRFKSYPTALVMTIDRIEASVDWKDESGYPLQLNEFRISRNQRDVPVNVLNEGKPVVVAYLYIIHDWDKEEIAGMLNLSSGTVQQYLTNVRTGTR